jgi:hypothetical protein
VNIVEVVGEKGMPKDTYSLSFRYPQMPRPVGTVSEREFRQQYIEKLAFEIVGMHIDHKPSNTIGDGK